MMKQLQMDYNAGQGSIRKKQSQKKVEKTLDNSVDILSPITLVANLPQ